MYGEAAYRRGSLQGIEGGMAYGVAGTGTATGIAPSPLPLPLDKRPCLSPTSAPVAGRQAPLS